MCGDPLPELNYNPGKKMSYPHVSHSCHMSHMQVYSGAHGRAMVFTATKQEANELALNSALKQECQVLHGDIPQRQREITLKVSGVRYCIRGALFRIFLRGIRSMNEHTETVLLLLQNGARVNMQNNKGSSFARTH